MTLIARLHPHLTLLDRCSFSYLVKHKATYTGTMGADSYPHTSCTATLRNKRKCSSQMTAFHVVWLLSALWPHSPQTARRWISCLIILAKNYERQKPRKYKINIVVLFIRAYTARCGHSPWWRKPVSGFCPEFPGTVISSAELLDVSLHKVMRNKSDSVRKASVRTNCF